jgi:DNA repair protein RadC
MAKGWHLYEYRWQRRLLAELPQVKGPRSTIAAVAQHIEHLTNGMEQEATWVVALDFDDRIMAAELIALGAASSVHVAVREVFRTAVRIGAEAIVVLHNHPSGDPTPSDEDISVGKDLAQAGRILGIPLLDFIVLGDHRYVSMMENDAPWLTATETSPTSGESDSAPEDAADRLAPTSTAS